MVPSVKRITKTITWKLPEYYDGKRSVTMTYLETCQFCKKLIESLKDDLENKRWGTIFE